MQFFCHLDHSLTRLLPHILWVWAVDIAGFTAPPACTLISLPLKRSWRCFHLWSCKRGSQRGGRSNTLHTSATAQACQNYPKLVHAVSCHLDRNLTRLLPHIQWVWEVDIAGFTAPPACTLISLPLKRSWRCFRLWSCKRGSQRGGRSNTLHKAKKLGSTARLHKRARTTPS